MNGDLIYRSAATRREVKIFDVWEEDNPLPRDALKGYGRDERYVYRP